MHPLIHHRVSALFPTSDCCIAPISQLSGLIVALLLRATAEIRGGLAGDRPHGDRHLFPLVGVKWPVWFFLLSCLLAHLHWAISLDGWV